MPDNLAADASIFSNLSNRSRERARSPGRAGLWVPSRRIRLFFEIGACDEWLKQILGIFDDGRHHEPGIAVALPGEIEEFFDDCVCAVRSAILSQVSRPQQRGYYLE